jgi:hypothetical protein
MSKAFENWAEAIGIREKYRPAILKLGAAFDNAVDAGDALLRATHMTVVATTMFAKAWFELWRASRTLRGVTAEELYEQGRPIDQRGPRP